MTQHFYTLEEAGIRLKGYGDSQMEAYKDAKYKMLKRHLERKNRPCLVYDLQDTLIYSNYRARFCGDCLDGSKPDCSCFKYRVEELDLIVIELIS